MSHRPGPGWVPRQHGAWAMLALPLVVGAVHAGPRWWHLLLASSWTVGYLAFHAAGLWLRSHGRSRYLPPVRVYGVLAVLLGGATVLVEPGVLVWAPLYAVLLTASLSLSWHREDRSLTNGMVTVLATSVMALVAQAPASPDAAAWWIAGTLAAYFAGTVLYVKTMIRERGSRPVYAASVLFHVLAVAAVAAGAVAAGESTAITVAAALVLGLVAARAIVVPRRWPGLRPLTVGLGEIAASLALGVVLVLA
ncbi:YwiC-like family protein [Actinotalea sp.]|uniref:YwiC-like family protein n=1 Tax=Actinotalea sp. TaxID=1872145 RepID=UPI003569BA81